MFLINLSASSQFPLSFYLNRLTIGKWISKEKTNLNPSKLIESVIYKGATPYKEIKKINKLRECIFLLDSHWSIQNSHPFP